MAMQRPPSDELRCIAPTRKGSRCRRAARTGSDVCHVHDPDRPKQAIAPEQRCAGTNIDGQPCGARADIGPWCKTHASHPPGHTPPDERRCTAISTGGTTRPERRGERCRQWASPGQSVCIYHGGAAPQARIAAQRRIAEQELLMEASNLVGTPVDNPLTELAAVAGRARAWMELMQSRVELLLQIANDDTEAAASERAGGMRYRDTSGEQLRAEVGLYERAMDRLGKFLTDYARLDIDNRLAAITTSQADRVIDAIDAALAAAGIHDKTQIQAAKKAAAAKLRVLPT
jgi:hypothetical protein